jgi:hypothetical protein
MNARLDRVEAKLGQGRNRVLVVALDLDGTYRVDGHAYQTLEDVKAYLDLDLDDDDDVLLVMDV